MIKGSGFLVAAALLLALATGGAVAGQSSAKDAVAGGPPLAGVLDEHPAIQYAVRPTRDRVAMLNRAIAGGSVSLAFRPANGYLDSVLQALNVPSESQLLVFSRTGIQRAVTGPANPRALFFDDSVVVGYIPGAQFIEVAAHDPEQGVVFYVLDQQASATPAFRRGSSCLSCHVSASTLEVPGMIVRSNFMSDEGDVRPQFGSFLVDHRTPLPERWGGWFVTGQYTAPPYNGVAHMGNVTFSAAASEVGPVTTSNEALIRWLNSSPESRGYPSADSDIAALMIFDHQMRAVNLLTRLSWEARVAASESRLTFERGILRALVNDLADYLLFVDEAPPPGRVTPRKGLAERFTAAGPRDRQGRSLRQLDLENRLLRFSCSYMIYSAAFENLPPEIRTAVYRRLWTILSGATEAKYAHLSTLDRRAIVEILRDTKKDLPAFFRPRG